MKNLLLLFLVGTIILSSCSTGNMASNNFSKRKYTKGIYKPEKNDYSVAKKNKKSDDTKYVVNNEKNISKQSYKLNRSKVEKKERTRPSNSEVVVVEKSTKTYEKREEASANSSTRILSDGIVNSTKIEEDNVISTPEAETAPKKVPGDKAQAGEILGYIGFAFGILALLLASLGWLSWGLIIGGLVLGLIGLGTSIASWILSGQSVWNLVGVITSAIAIALSILWMILVFAI